MVEVVAWSSADVARVLRMPTAADDKYSRGVVGLRTGSTDYPGAAVLGVEAAWRTGVGMVRYLGPARDLVLARRPETVTTDGRVQAWVIGSGTDPSTRSRAETGALRAILARTEPVIVDAGALDLAQGASAPVIVTPHDREHARLREALDLGGGGGDRAADAVDTAAALDAVVLLKGSSTLVATRGGMVLRVDAGVPWLATAGTGDVLAGAIGALVAAAGSDGAVPDAASLAALAASGAWLHGRAGALASAAYGSCGGPITALDVADALPRAVGDVLAGR